MVQDKGPKNDLSICNSGYLAGTKQQQPWIGRLEYMIEKALDKE